MQYTVSPIGILRIISDGHAITHVQRVTVKSENSPDALTKKCVSELQEYFDTKKPAFRVSLRPEGTEFQQAVWKAMRKIPYGERISYAALAKTIGKPKSMRAVGSACSKNPILILTPCHRVIRSSGRLGGFSAGIKAKRLLLEAEARYSA